MTSELKGKTALVTAATRGIGFACVKKLASMGATVYMGARRMEFASQLCDEMKAQGMDVRPVYFNAYEDGCYHNMMQDVQKDSGRLDILVNNFGTSDPTKDKTIEDTDFEVFKETLNVDLESVFCGIQEAIPLMKENGGSIVNISSVGGLYPDISQVGYGTSKAAINFLTKIAAVQLGRYKIRVNAVCPGMTATDAVKDNLSDQFRDIFIRQTPLGRMATPEEIADAVAYFASDGAAFTTGQILAVAGGFGLGTPVYGDLMNSANRR